MSDMYCVRVVRTDMVPICVLESDGKLVAVKWGCGQVSGQPVVHRKINESYEAFAIRVLDVLLIQSERVIKKRR